MNPLTRYFDAETEETPTRLASRIGRAPSTITRVLKAERRPSLALAKAIEAGTNGQIKALELVTFFLDEPIAQASGAAPTPGAGGEPPQGDARESPDLLPGPLVASPALCDPGDGVVSEATPQSRLSAASLFSDVAKERQVP